MDTFIAITMHFACEALQHPLFTLFIIGITAAEITFHNLARR